MSELPVLKQQNIERYVRRARGAWEKSSGMPFAEDYDKQDVIVLNLQRACELVLDMANHTVRMKKLGWPRDSAESFVLLREAGIIDAELENKLKGMVGFRNIVVHQYKDIDLDLVKKIVCEDADNLIEFSGTLVSSFSK